jgi:hypothetical protein
MALEPHHYVIQSAYDMRHTGCDTVLTEDLLLQPEPPTRSFHFDH